MKVFRAKECCHTYIRVTITNYYIMLQHVWPGLLGGQRFQRFFKVCFKRIDLEHILPNLGCLNVFRDNVAWVEFVLS